MKKYLNLIIPVFLSIILTSCDEFGDTNLDPGRPGGENVSLVAITPTMQTQTHRNIVASAGRLAGIITQQFIGFDAQQVAFTQYAIPEGTLANFWEFGLYTGSMRDCADMIERANTSGENTHTRGLAKIYMAVNLGLATNCFGDIPYTEAFLGADNLAPSYDSQEQIYSTIHTLLDEAIADFGQSDPPGPLGDLVGASDWISVAHALKARFYMQLTKRDASASTKALSEIALAFSSNNDSPIFQFEGTPNGGNPLALFGIQRPNTLIIDPFFDNLMAGDPRKVKFMVPNVDGDQLYFENGNIDLFWAQYGSPSPLISYSELKFLEAEALFRTGADPVSAMQEGIKANMDFVGIPAADADAYIATVTGTDLQTIMLEKYKSMYGAAPMEIWNDYRRTGFPALTANAQGANGSNPSGIVPRRFLYPDSERLGNTEAYEAAISNQGGHLLDDDMWAFKD
ncbi:SusD/RagB family nutrient-binding outer membrane lipoprotein [Maribacter sp.]|uniref:SusD/RagB family nutrient-binding outer membrane lipoprotein n=1 Tax=Maribacter sp. TaxID=1897614 RepID=UPI0025C590AE|nr:SusD/RagB family nutrient-binding outer membrane lipoprotein [Maribacter sp.]